MKKLPFIILIFSISIFSQIPSYYNDVNLNLSGSDLKDELATKIITTHTNFLSYDWDVVREADLNPSNSSEVILTYGWNDNDSDVSNDRTRGAFDNGGNVGDWNREHTFARSLGNPDLGTSGPGSDVHNLRACDLQRNSTRNNNLFAAGSGSASYLTSSGGFFPGDEWKGDVARIVMYMYLRYGNQCLPDNVAIGSSVSSDTNMVDLLLTWNAEDPVSTFEQQRNSVIADNQGNRNPFIDNPAFATAIWGGPQAEDLFGNTGDNNGGGSDNDGDGTISDLIISEYAEGSSYNKAIEIANFTGSSVNLSSYSVLKTTNGNNTWSSTYNLSGTLANGDVIVIAHTSATLFSADFTTSSAMNFNGNDAVALFKNGSLIDVVGTPNSSSNFGQNTTLRRIATVTSPNTSYTTSEWDAYASNTVSDFGSHTVDGSSSGGGNDGGGSSDTPDVTYCTAQGNNDSYEYIDYVALGGISNVTSGNGGYGDFTAQTGSISYGSNTIIISAGFASSSYTEYWKVWIDFDQNGSFDSDEEVVSGSSSSSGNLSATFSVPTSANSGATRMRVAMKWGSEPTSCETFSYGEVEDYTVIIGSARITNSEEAVISAKELHNEAALFTASVYPNPSSDFIAIGIEDQRAVTFNLYNTMGQKVKSGSITRNIDIKALRTGMYILEVNDGQKSVTTKVLKR